MGLLKTRSPVLSLDLGANFLFVSSQETRADGAADVVVAVLMSPPSSQSFMATGAAIWKTVASGVVGGPIVLSGRKNPLVTTDLLVYPYFGEHYHGGLVELAEISPYQHDI